MITPEALLPVANGLVSKIFVGALTRATAGSRLVVRVQSREPCVMTTMKSALVVRA
jgi:hypothetical protein